MNNFLRNLYAKKVVSQTVLKETLNGWNLVRLKI